MPAAMLAACATLALLGTTAPPKPTATEAAFVARVAQTLTASYPTRAAAERSGYMALSTKIGADGTYDLTNMDFAHVSLAHPNFLWYDRSGRLVGTDYELPTKQYPKPPALFPVASTRWSRIHEHVHFAYELGGKVVLAGARAKPNLRTAHPSAAALRADGDLPKGATLRWAMYHPEAWDLAIWTVANPNGAFADLNPLVKK